MLGGSRLPPVARTTLRLIAGLERITSGTISIGGHAVNDKLRGKIQAAKALPDH